MRAGAATQPALLRGGSGATGSASTAIGLGRSSRSPMPPPSSSLWKVAEESEPRIAHVRSESPNVEENGLSGNVATSSSSAQGGMDSSQVAAALLARTLVGDRNALATSLQMHGKFNSGEASRARMDCLPQQRPTDTSNFVVKNTFIECGDGGDKKPEGLSAIHFRSEQVSRQSPEELGGNLPVIRDGLDMSMLSPQELAHLDNSTSGHASL